MNPSGVNLRPMGVAAEHGSRQPRHTPAHQFAADPPQDTRDSTWEVARETGVLVGEGTVGWLARILQSKATVMDNDILLLDLAEEEHTRVARVATQRSWEWPALTDLIAMLIFAMVLVGAIGGMLLKVINPQRRARSLARVVQDAAHTAQAVADRAIEEVATTAKLVPEERPAARDSAI